MVDSAVRAIHPQNTGRNIWPFFVVVALLGSMASPGIVASADQRIETQDFQILNELDYVLQQDESIKADPRHETKRVSPLI